MFPSFSHHYAALPDRMRAESAPTPVTEPSLIVFNHSLAQALGFDAAAFDPLKAAEVLSGSRLPDGVRPVAAAYAGHQFGNFVAQLGDGRALLLGELPHADGGLREVQLKGAGRTPFSRGGDGRAPIGPVLREYLVSEAMHALGVPTTRALAAVATGESVFRQLPEPGAVLTRVATSHLRVGTFQYFAVRGDKEALETLVALAIERHYPDLGELPEPERPLALLEAVVGRQAALIAQWKGLGFIHGVMNTDNCALSGETIDYGPCAFMDNFHPATVFSSIDERGRYAWDNQPAIAQWNLARLAETLLPLIDADQERAVEQATRAIEAFSEHHERQWARVLRAKLGLCEAHEPSPGADLALGEALLDAMDQGSADFTLSFRRLALVLHNGESGESGESGEPGEQGEQGEQGESAEPTQGSGEATLRQGFERSQMLNAWLPRWRERLARESASSVELATRLEAANPAVIPRNHQVERVIRAAIDDDDLAPFEHLLAAVTRPFDTPDDDALIAPPARDQRVLRTFCGT